MRFSVATRKSQKRARFSLQDDYQKLLYGIATWNQRDEVFRFKNGHQLVCAPADDPNRFGSSEIASFFIQEAQRSRVADLRCALRPPAFAVCEGEGQAVFPRLHRRPGRYLVALDQQELHRRRRGTTIRVRTSGRRLRTRTSCTSGCGHPTTSSISPRVTRRRCVGSTRAT